MLLNESYFDTYKIKKGDVIGYLVVEPEDLKMHYETKEKHPSKHPRKKQPGKRNIQVIIYPKTGRKIGRNTGRKKKKMSRRQTGGFLSRYDFAYTGRDVVNQAGKVAPKIISQATGEINKIAQDRIDQAIRSGGAEIEWVAPKIIRGAIEEIYKTPFRLLGNLGKKQFQKIKRKLFK